MIIKVLVKLNEVKETNNLATHSLNLLGAQEQNLSYHILYYPQLAIYRPPYCALSLPVWRLTAPLLQNDQERRNVVRLEKLWGMSCGVLRGEEKKI